MKKTIRAIKNQIQYALTHILFSKVFNRIGPDSIVIDCGANVGDIAWQFAKRGATVYAFEPNPHAFERLSTRMEAFPKVTCINKGVWIEAATMNLYFHEQAGEDQVFWSFGSSIIREKNNISDRDFVEVELIDLTGFIDELDTEIDLLKIDIEGAEGPVLKKLIEKEQYERIGQIVVETHERKIAGQAEEMKAIRKMINERNITHITLGWL
jgi:FkbM family methyltransferase